MGALTFLSVSGVLMLPAALQATVQLQLNPVPYVQDHAYNFLQFCHAPGLPH